MFFSISQKDLITGLQIVMNAVPQKSTLPILSNILFETTDDNKISFSATDLDISITTLCLAKVEKKGALAIPARKMFEIVRELPSDRDIEIKADGQKVTIKSDRGDYKLMGMDKDEFPTLPEKSFEKAFSVPISLMQYMLKKTIYSVSTDETRPTLNGVLWEISPEELSMVATDGHRLARMKVKNKECGWKESIRIDTTSNVIIPPKGLKALLQFSSADDYDVSVVIDENHIVFKALDTIIYSRLIEGPFPPYNQVIPKDNTKVCTVNRIDLSSALRRVAIFSNVQNHQVRFGFRHNRLELDVRTPDVGEAKEELTCEYLADDLDVGYNAHYILDVMKAMDSEAIVIALNSPLSAGLFTPSSQPAGEDYLCLVMPLRLTGMD